MIRVSDPAKLGQAIDEIRALLGYSRNQLAIAVADATGRSRQGVVNQLCDWANGNNSPTAKSLPPVLAELGYDLALIPREP